MMLNLDYLNQLLSISALSLQLPTFRQQVGKNGHNLAWLQKHVARDLSPTDDLARYLSMDIKDLCRTPLEAPVPPVAVFATQLAATAHRVNKFKASNPGQPSPEALRQLESKSAKVHTSQRGHTPAKSSPDQPEYRKYNYTPQKAQ